MLGTLVNFSAVDFLKYFVIFPRKKDLTFHAKCQIRHFMQIISIGENLHEISNHIFLGKIRKISPIFLSAELAQRVVKDNIEPLPIIQGPVVQSIVSLTSSLRVISFSVLVESIYNILIFFAKKM